MDFIIFCAAQFVFTSIGFTVLFFNTTKADDVGVMRFVFNIVLFCAIVGSLNAALLHYKWGINIVGWWS